MLTRRLKIAIKDHGGKARAFVAALRAAGHEFVPEGPADALLTDLDPPIGLHKAVIDRYAEMGAKVILYPHAGGGAVLSYDALWEPDPRVFANLVTGVGQAEYLRRLDYPSLTYGIGWTYCDFRPFRPCEDVRRVVYAPTHPVGGGWMTEYQRELNTSVFERLLETPFELTVRHVGSLKDNGLREVEGVTYVDGRRSPQLAEIDVADVVVGAHGTMTGLALARGVPTVMFTQGVVALGMPGDSIAFPRRPELYMDYVRYPFDADEGPLEEVIRLAARSEEPVLDWKRRFVGKRFDPRHMIALLERIIIDESPVRIDPTRSFTTVASVDELLERPELLATYAAAFAPEDDASLLLWAPGVEAATLLEWAERAIELAGLDANRLPDILLSPLPGSPEVDRVLSERANAVLTEWPATGLLGKRPRFGAGEAAALRAAAGLPATADSPR